jgi:hypothetical protein
MTAAASLAKTPSPPYYAVIFTSQRADGDRGYRHMADRMIDLASKQPGFLGVESVRGTDGFRYHGLVLVQRGGDNRLEGTFAAQSCARNW